MLKIATEEDVARALAAPLAVHGSHFELRADEMAQRIESLKAETEGGR